MQQRRWSLVRSSVFAALLLALTSTLHAAPAITNVVVANVTPSSFSLVWHMDGVPSVDVFADAAGSSNLAGVVAVEFDPVHTGNSGLTNDYERRLHRTSLRARARSMGMGHVRVSGLVPDKTYYYRITARLGNNTTQTYPGAGLASVRTARETSFVRDAQQLILDVPGLDNDGRIVTLTHSNAAFALASVVGDGAATNQVVFNVADLLALGGLTNFTATGSQEFSVDLHGPNNTHTLEQFTLVFSDAFNIAQSAYNSFGIEFAALSVGSTVLRAGSVGTVPLTFNASVGVREFTAQLQVPTDRLVELALSNLPSAVASATIVSNSPTSASLHVLTHAGQVLQGALSLGELRFRAASNQTSAFVPMRLAMPSLVKLDATSVSNVIVQPGRVVVVAEQPLLEAFAAADGTRRMHLYGKPWSAYAIEYTAGIGQPWQVHSRTPLTNLVTTIANLHGNTGNWFYRAYELGIDPPAIEALASTNGTRRFLVYGQPGGNYTLQSTPGLSATATWSPVLSYTLTNSFTYLENVSSNGAAAFFRLRRNGP